MGLKDPITMADAMNLKNIQKKLKLPLAKLAKAQKLNTDASLTDDQKVRQLLNIPDDMETEKFLETRLTESELVTIKKFVKF